MVPFSIGFGYHILVVEIDTAAVTVMTDKADPLKKICVCEEPDGIYACIMRNLKNFSGFRFSVDDSEYSQSARQ